MVKSNNYSFFVVVVVVAIAMIISVGVKSVDGVIVDNTFVTTLTITGSLGCVPALSSSPNIYLACKSPEVPIEQAQITALGLYTITLTESDLVVNTDICLVYAKVPIEGCPGLGSGPGLAGAELTNLVIIPEVSAAAIANFDTE